MIDLASVVDRPRPTPSDREAAPISPGRSPLNRRRVLRLDGAITAAIMVAVCFEYAFPFDDGAHAGDQHVSLVLSLLTVLPLAVRRLRPMTSFVIMCAVLGLPGLVIAHTFLFFGGLLPLLLGLATVFRYHRLRVAIWAVPLLLVSLLTAYVHTTKVLLSADSVFLLIFIGLAAFIGVVLRSSARRREDLADALGRVQQANAVRDRTAVLAERSRVARDLHDVVAHAVSLMLVQAGAARLALEDGDRRVAEDFLAGVQRAGVGAERELAAMLRALRSDHDEVAGGPGASLDAVPDLVDQMRAAGLDITLHTLGRRPQLSPGLDLAAFRIIQEGLTNVLRHAGPTEVELTVSYQQPLQITMIDSGPKGARPAVAGSGQGLIGMAERASLFGGEVQAEPLARGWLLRVRLPIPEALR